MIRYLAIVGLAVLVGVGIALAWDAHRRPAAAVFYRDYCKALLGVD